MWGAITMKMMSSTNTTSTSGVTLMAAFIFWGSPSRMGRPRSPEENVHELVAGLVDLDLEALERPGEVVERHHRRNRHEDPQRRRDEGLGDAARDRRHPARSRGRDAAEGVDDPDDGAEQADERRRGADRGQCAQTALHADHRLDLRVLDGALDELEGSVRIAAGVARAGVL